MQVKAISVPVEARGSWLGSAGAFLALSRWVTEVTHVMDERTGWPAPQPSVHVMVPFGRNILLGGVMVHGSLELGDLARMSAEDVREWVIGDLLLVGTYAAHEESCSEPFRAGYAGQAHAAALFAELCARVDEAFGFSPAAGAADVTGGSGSAPRPRRRRPAAAVPA